MKFLSGIILTCLLILGACAKKDKQADIPPEPVIVTLDTTIRCGDLPPTPKPFGWQDSLNDENKNINAFLFNPVNDNEIIYVVNGDAFGYNKLFVYDIPTKKATQLGILGDYLPQVNKRGWITYSDVNNNIIVVKTNGDSLKTLVPGGHALDPKWDHTGNYIYYYSEQYFTLAARLLKITLEGVVSLEYLLALPGTAPFKKSDKIIYIQPQNTNATLILKDFLAPSTETILISGPLYSKAGQMNFDNLCLDNTDENFYWSNSNGIFRCNLATLKTETLFKNCQNFIFNNPIMAIKRNELTYSHRILKPISAYRLLNLYKAMEMDLYNSRSKEINIYP